MTPVRDRAGRRREFPARTPAPRLAGLFLLMGVVALVGLLAAACGPTAASPASSGASPSVAPSAPGATPSAPAASGDTGPQPSPTPWPGSVVETVLALGKADLEIEAAGADLGAAAAYEDPEAMWGAADGLATLVERMIPYIDRIRDYPATAELAARYDASLPTILAGAKQLRDAITNGDAAGVTAGSQQLSQGIEAYAAVRPLLGPLVEQAVLMQRLLVK